MMFNNFLSFSQKKFNFLYKNSLFLQNIDKFVLPFILLTFVSSTFMNSDYIGLFALVVMFLTFIKVLVTPEERFELKNFEIWLVVYFMLVIVSLFGSSLFMLSLKGFFKTFVYIGFYFSVVQYLKNHKNHIPILFGTIGVCAVSEGLLGVFQSTLHLEQISTWQDTSGLNPEDVISRVYGSLKPLNPNLFGGYLVGTLPIVIGAIFYFLHKKHKKMAIISAIGGSAIVYAILQTGCRGAYLAMLVAFASIFLISAKFFWKNYKKWYLSIIGSAFALFTMMLLFVNSIRLRFLSIFAMRGDSSNSFRFNVYHSSLEMFKDNWLLGIGVGNKNFREIYGLYMKTGFDALSAYNIYLETAVESGIFALIAFLGFLITVSYEGVKYILKSENTEKIIFLASSIVCVWVVMFHGLVDTIYFRPQLQFVFWTMIGIISVLLKEDEHING